MNINPNCDHYLPGYDCIDQNDALVCDSCIDFHEVGYAPETQAEVTTPPDVWLTDESWNDPDDHDEF